MSQHAAPSGTVTFLFTDIEGSTVRWDSYPEAMRDAVRKHDELMRAAISANNGYVFKTVGDAFCAAFSTAHDGVSAALAAQNAFAAEDFSVVEGLRVRMALHTGAADERDGDYFGGAVNRVARLLAIGHGGQVLLSGVTAKSAQERLPAKSNLFDLGMHRLRDLSEPEHVFQLTALGLTDAFPELKSLNALPNNLPAQLSPLIGRSSELSEVASLLERARLVTVAGPGGIGKTRIALQVAADLLEADGAWFINLAPVNDPALIPSALAEVFNVRDSGSHPLIDGVVAALKKKKLLIVLDNCEHLIEAAADAAARLLQGCPEVRVLATSREPLGIPGEEVFRTPALTDEAGAALFVARAQGVKREFSVDAAAALIVEEIVYRLDGIAFAIELAAARVRVLSLAQLREKLNERFKLLTGAGRTMLPRQQTLRATIDWSYDLLAEDERRMFRQLSVFAGSFTLDLATAVCSGVQIEEYQVLDLLTSLVDKSLVHEVEVNGEARYRLLESTREFAYEKLTEAAELSSTLQRHALAYTELAETLDAEWRSYRDSAKLATSKYDLDNWRAALKWAFGEDGDAALAQRLAGQLRFVWERYAPAEGRRWIEKARGAAVSSEETAVRLNLAEAHLAIVLTQYKVALKAAYAALDLLRSREDALSYAEAQLLAGVSAAFLDRVGESNALLTESLSAFRALRLQHDVASALQALGLLCMNSGDIAGAREYYAEAREQYVHAGADARAAHLALNLAEVEFQSGDASEALRLAQEAVASDRVRGNENSVVYGLCNIAAYQIALDRPAEAAICALEAITLSQKLGSETALAFALQHVAASVALRTRGQSTFADEISLSAALLGFVNRKFENLGYAREYTEQKEYDRALLLLHQTLETDLCAARMSDGVLWDDGRAIEAATALISSDFLGQK